MLILLSTLTVLKKKIPDKECFYSSAKDGTTGDNGKKLDGHMSDEDYWAWKTWKVNWLTHVSNFTD